MSVQYTKLAYTSIDEFAYGICPHPVTCKNGMVIGGGEIYPEINFTLPSMPATAETFPEAKRIYQEIITGVLDKAHQLHAPGLVVSLRRCPSSRSTRSGALRSTRFCGIPCLSTRPNTA